MLLEALDLVYLNDGAGEETGLAGVSLTARGGERLGVVGTSGSGKTTLGRVISADLVPRRGRAEIDGRSLVRARGLRLRRLRSGTALVRQDLLDLFPSMEPIGTTFQRTLRRAAVPRSARDAVIERASAVAGLDPSALVSRPHDLSGGELQRAAVAVSIIGEPRIIVLDEPLVAIGPEARAEALSALMAPASGDAAQTLASPYPAEALRVLISHDLDDVGRFTDRVVVMEDGGIVEEGPTADVFTHPQSQVTADLLEQAEAERIVDRRRIREAHPESPSEIRP